MLDPTVSGLIGVGIGAVTGLIGTLLANWLQLRRENAQWLREKKVEAYTNSIRYLTRVVGKRSNITAEGDTYIAQEHTKELFDDLAEIRHWVMRTEIYCSAHCKEEIRAVARGLSITIDAFIEGKIASSSGGIPYRTALETIQKCARIDLLT